jgi:hypothetical protein
MEPHDEQDPEMERRLKRARRIIWKCALNDEEFDDVLESLFDASIDPDDLPETLMLDIQKQAKRMPDYFEELAHKMLGWANRKRDYI